MLSNRQNNTPEAEDGDRFGGMGLAIKDVKDCEKALFCEVIGNLIDLCGGGDCNGGHGKEQVGSADLLDEADGVAVEIAEIAKVNFREGLRQERHESVAVAVLENDENTSIINVGVGFEDALIGADEHGVACVYTVVLEEQGTLIAVIEGGVVVGAGDGVEVRRLVVGELLRIAAELGDVVDTIKCPNIAISGDRSVSIERCVGDTCSAA